MKDISNIPTKWRWIRNTCEDLGFQEAAEIANEIDILLELTYPDELQITNNWAAAYLKHTLYKGSEPTPNDIRIIANSASYCTGCIITGISLCKNCKFYHAGGSELHDLFISYLEKKK